MPICDLLATITGEAPKPIASSKSPKSALLPKRKASRDLDRSDKKTSRTAGAADVYSGPGVSSASKSITSPDESSPGPSFERLASRLNDTSTRIPEAKKSRSALNSANRGKSGISKPVAGRASEAPKAQPKKRSFAEIMARAAANQETKVGFGNVAHKPLERGLGMKERKELKAERARNKKAGSNLARSAVSGTKLATSSWSPSKQPLKVEKKVKKAALATTGYTGTARPRPGAVSSKAGSTSQQRAEAPTRERAHYGGALAAPRRKRNDYDEELDDFIEYDDEDDPEPGYGRASGYDSLEDDESDMEAGISDIADEEIKTERLAIREDREQETIEKKLKREKAEKKRKLQGRR